MPASSSAANAFDSLNNPARWPSSGDLQLAQSLCERSTRPKGGGFYHVFRLGSLARAYSVRGNVLGRRLPICDISGLSAKFAARRSWTRFATTARAQGSAPDGAQVTTDILT